MAQIKDYPQQTTRVSTDKILMQDVGGVTKYVTATEALNQAGFNDLTPINMDYSGASSPALATVVGTRRARAFAGTGGTTNEVWFAYHLPHDIALTMTNYEYHLHLEHNNPAPTGNVKFYLDMYVA